MKDFTLYPEALELKQLGFDEPCFGYWYTEQEEFKKIDIQLSSIGFLEGEPDYILAPTYSQAFRWFREEHNYHVIIDFNQSKGNKWYYSLLDITTNHAYPYNNDFETYEEAEIAALQELIKTVKEGKK